MQGSDDKLRALSAEPAPWAISFESVAVRVGDVAILDGVDAKIPAGGCTAIVGPNGAGKTTLIMCLLGEMPYSGFIRLAPGRSGSSPVIGYVPQRLDFDRGMPLTVLEFLAAGFQRRPFWFGVKRSFRKRAAELLESVGCEGLQERRLGALSGGELQRVLLALALEQRPDILILDEPAAGIDLKGDQICCSLLSRFRQERGFTQLMVSHDLSTVAAHATNVICLNKKVCASGPVKETLTPHVLAATFGLHMGIPESGALPLEKSPCHCSDCETVRKRHG